MKELACAIRWVRATLKARVELAGLSVEPVVTELMPNGVSIYYVPGSRDQRTRPGSDILFTTLRIRVILSLPQQALNAAIVAQASAIQTALERQVGSNADGQVFWCERVTIIEYSERGDNGQTWMYYGAEYELDVKGA